MRVRWRPFWLRLRLGWDAWGAGVDARVGRNVSLGRRVQVFALPGSTLIIEDGVQLRDGVVLVAREGGLLRIGRGSYLGPGSELHAAERVEIGAGCLLAGQVVAIDHDHEFDLREAVQRKTMQSAPVHVGDGCWLATRVIVTSGAEIGDACVVAGGAVVSGTIPTGSLAGGVPARVLRRAEDL